MDNAQKISKECWNWYMRASGLGPHSKNLNVLIDDASKICDKYKENEVDYRFAIDMFLVFINRIERLM